jgi:hypothetical protein
MNASQTKVFAWSVSAAVLLAAGYGLYVSGSPSQERARKMDGQRLSDLQQIASAMDIYWNQKTALPTTLQELQSTRDVYVGNILDPVTRQSYAYSTKTVDSFELCAQFETDTTADDASIPQPYTYYGNGGPTFWKHPIGRHCYTIEVHKNDPLTPKPL